MPEGDDIVGSPGALKKFLLWRAPPLIEARKVVADVLCFETT